MAAHAARPQAPEGPVWSCSLKLDSLRVCLLHSRGIRHAHLVPMVGSEGISVTELRLA